MSAEPPYKRSKMDESGPSTPVDNPYLAHHKPQNGYASSGYASGANGVGAVNGKGAVKNPLNGLTPRQVTVAQAKEIMVSRNHNQANFRMAM
jgi:hypothetical protein